MSSKKIVNFLEKILINVHRLICNKCLFGFDESCKWIMLMEKQIKEYKNKLVFEKNRVNELISENKTLKKLIPEEQDPLEKYWNNKRPKSNILYPGRPLFLDETPCRVDPRIFFTIDHTLPTFIGTNDDKARKCLCWVHENIKYTEDYKEFWQFAFETLKRKKGDCEDQAILMANMMIMSGVSYWRIRLNAGTVKGGGHAYVTYLSEKDNKWYILDSCYWYSESRGLKKLFKDAEKYFGIWFSWNTKHIYLNEEYERKNEG